MAREGAEEGTQAAGRDDVRRGVEDPLGEVPDRPAPRLGSDQESREPREVPDGDVADPRRPIGPEILGIEGLGVQTRPDCPHDVAVVGPEAVVRVDPLRGWFGRPEIHRPAAIGPEPPDCDLGQGAGDSQASSGRIGEDVPVGPDLRRRLVGARPCGGDEPSLEPAEPEPVAQVRRGSARKQLGQGVLLGRGHPRFEGARDESEDLPGRGRVAAPLARLEALDLERPSVAELGGSMFGHLYLVRLLLNPKREK